MWCVTIVVAQVLVSVPKDRPDQKWPQVIHSYYSQLYNYCLINVSFYRNSWDRVNTLQPVRVSMKSSPVTVVVNKIWNLLYTLQNSSDPMWSRCVFLTTDHLSLNNFAHAIAWLPENSALSSSWGFSPSNGASPASHSSLSVVKEDLCQLHT